jgi:hypothetical protein
MDLQTLKFIIEALRQKPVEPGIYRDPGHAPRRMGGGIADMLRNSQREAGYGKYQRMQEAIGESAVSPEEYMRNM